jgi:recombination protein RecA
MKIGVMFGNPETTTGGNALKFYSSVRIDLRRIEAIKRGEEFIGNRIRAKVIKNKVAPPFRDAEIEIFFDEGISRSSDIMDMGVKNEIIQKMGSWFSFENEKLGQGREGVKKYLQENPKILNRIEKLILAKYEAAKK